MHSPWPSSDLMSPLIGSANNVSGFRSHKESRVNIQWLHAQKGCCFWQNVPEWFPKWYLFILKLCTQQMSGWADFSNPGTNGEVGWQFGALTQEILKWRLFRKYWLSPLLLSKYIHLTHQLVIVNCALNCAGDSLMKCCFTNSSGCCSEFAFAFKIASIFLLIKNGNC